MPTFGLIGPTYTGQALTAEGERTLNWYPEAIESPTGKTKETAYILVETPGLAPFANIASAVAVQAEYKTPDGRAFAVAANQLWELSAAGTLTLRGPLSAGTSFCFAANPTQVLIASGQNGWIFDLTLNSLTPITSAGWVGGSSCAYIDGYFVALEPNSQIFTISALNDGTQWDPLDFGRAEGAAGNFVALIADHLDLWLFGTDHAEAYYDSGDANFPFTRRYGSFMQQGLAAAGTLAQLDNTIFWLGQDSRGAGIVWRANGYTPARISNHAIEFAIQGYATIADATAYAFQWQGHSFYRLDFPSANATWVYDCATQMWHEWLSWSQQLGSYVAHLGRTHMFAFGKHLVGDYTSGNIYQLSATAYTDNGAPIRRMRTSPHVSNELGWIYYSELTLDVQTGVGLDGATAPGTDPQITLQLSNDGGYTWGAERTISLGKLGATKQRVVWRRLGRARDRVFRLIVTDPVPCCLVNAYLSFK